jgi:hypothetical protein
LPHAAVLAFAYVLALPIGWDREHNERSAGLRTLPLVAVASCGFIQATEGITGNSTRSSSEAPKTHHPPLQYNSLRFQSRSMIRATVEVTFCRTGAAISTVTRSGRNRFLWNCLIETLRTMKGKGPETGPFVSRVQASGSLCGAPNGLRKETALKAAACDIEIIAITGAGPVHGLRLPQVLRAPCFCTHSGQLFDSQRRSCPGSRRCSGDEPGRHAGCDHAQSY